MTPTSEGTTLRAIAFAAGMSDSDVHEATYTYIGGNGPNPGGAESNQSGITPDYDGNGNLIAYKGWSFSYDAQNRLTRASNGTISAEFYYDGKNRQIARKIGGVIRFSVWDGWELLEEYAGGMQRTEAYLQGATGVIKSWGGANGTIYFYQDKLGSTTHIANASGALLENYRYDLYGTPSYYDQNGQLKANQVSGYGVNDLHAGERWVSELRVYDLRNRFMSPELGRFLQPDPIGFKGDPSNLYRYCHNDPVDFSDPMGLYETPAGGWENFNGGKPASYEMDAYRNSLSQPAGNISFAFQSRAEAGGDGDKVTGGFKDLGKMKEAAVRQDYAQIDKSGIGGKGRYEYGGYYLQRKDSHGHTEYGYSGPYKGQQGRVTDKYRKMREANYLVLNGRGALPVPKGWTKIGWHYAHVIPGNTIPADDKAVARDYHYIVGGAAPPLRRGVYYNPNNPMIEYYP